MSAQWCHQLRATIVTGSDDGLVRIWDASLGDPLVARLQGHSAPISCVAISREDDVIASGGDEGKVVLYSRPQHPSSVGSEQDNFLQH